MFSSKALVVVALLGSLAAVSFGQTTSTATFDFSSFSNPYGGDLGQFSGADGFVLLSVLAEHSATALTGAASQTISPSAGALTYSSVGGLGTTASADGQLRNTNAAGTALLAFNCSFLDTSPPYSSYGADIPPSSMDLALKGADNSGYLLYGSFTGPDTAKPLTQLTLIGQGNLNGSGSGSFDLTGADLSKYFFFYLAAANGSGNSVVLGNGTTASLPSAVPEPAPFLAFGLSALGLLLRRKKKV